MVSLDDDCKEKMEEVMIRWRDRGRSANTLDGGTTTAPNEGDVSLPLGPGEWEEALGLPLCVVCQNVKFSLNLNIEASSGSSLTRCIV